MTNPTSYYKTFQPSNSFLRQFIAYYYFDVSNDPSVIKKFIFYPHYKNALTVYQHSEVQLNEFNSVSRPNQNVPYTFLYTGAEPYPRLVEIVPPFNKIGIVFQPLGINHFLPQKTTIQQLLTLEKKGNFDCLSSEFTTTCARVYATDSFEDKVTLLDTFFEQQYKGFNETRLIRAVELLLADTTQSISKIASEIGTSRKTLYRLFKKHTNCSAEAYKGIIKFRNVIQSYQNQLPGTILTDLAYSNSYYDQSDFINHLKKVTGTTPKQFFSRLSNLGTEDTFWTLLEE